MSERTQVVVKAWGVLAFVAAILVWLFIVLPPTGRWWLAWALASVVVLVLGLCRAAGRDTAAEGDR